MIGTCTCCHLASPLQWNFFFACVCACEWVCVARVNRPVQVPIFLNQWFIALTMVYKPQVVTMKSASLLRNMEINLIWNEAVPEPKKMSLKVILETQIQGINSDPQKENNEILPPNLYMKLIYPINANDSSCVNMVAGLSAKEWLRDCPWPSPRYIKVAVRRFLSGWYGRI